MHIYEVVNLEINAMKVNTNLKLSFAFPIEASLTNRFFLWQRTSLWRTRRLLHSCVVSPQAGRKDYCTAAKIACFSTACRSSFYQGLSYGRRKSASLSSRLRNYERDISLVLSQPNLSWLQVMKAQFRPWLQAAVAEWEQVRSTLRSKLLRKFVCQN